MTKASERYPEDEFDAPPALDAPVGVHRAPRSWWSRWWPFVAVVVLVPVLTVGSVLWATSWDGLPSFSSSDDTTDDAAATQEPPADTGTEAAPEDEAPVESEEPPVETEAPPAPVADLAATVRVLNAANRSGLAASAQGDLEDAGFTSVTADNGNAGSLTASTVFYASADLAPTAQLVADTLGISAVVEDAGTAPEGVVVLLLRDFSR